MYGFNFNSQQQQQLMNKNKNSFKDSSPQFSHQQPYYSSNKNNFIQQPSLYNQYQEPQFVPHPSFFDNKNNQYFNPSNQYNINNQPFNNPRQNILESQQKQQQTYYSNNNNKLLQKPKQFNENNTFVYPPLQKQSLPLPVQSNVSSTISENTNVPKQQNKLDDIDSLREIKEQEIKDKIEKDFKEKMEKELKEKMEKEFQEEKEKKEKAFKEQLEREQNSFRELFEKELKELRLQIELEKQKLIDMEKQRLAELEKQRLAELEKQRLEELENQRLAELEKQRLSELEEQRLAELEEQRLAELEEQRLEEHEKQQLEEQNLLSNSDSDNIIVNQSKEIAEHIKDTLISKIENEIVDHLKKTLSQHFKSVISDSLSVISSNLDELKYVDSDTDNNEYNNSLFDDIKSVSDYKSNHKFNNSTIFPQEYEEIKRMDKKNNSDLSSNASVKQNTSSKPPVPSFKLTASLTGEAQPLQNTFSINESSLAARRKIVIDKNAIPKKTEQVIIPFYESSLKKKKVIKNEDINIVIPFVRDHKIVVSDFKEKAKNSSNRDYNNFIVKPTQSVKPDDTPVKNNVEQIEETPINITSENDIKSLDHEEHTTEAQNVTQFDIEAFLSAPQSFKVKQPINKLL